MFLSTSVAAKLGIEHVGTVSLGLFAIPVISRLFLRSKQLWNKCSIPELNVLLVAIFVCLLKYAIGDFPAIKSAFFFMMAPMLISILLKEKSFNTKKNLRNIILIFFLTECFFAIYERVLGVNIFPYKEDDLNVIMDVSYGFRSTAFLGHPLANALVVSTILGFLLISELRFIWKGLLFILGIAAILCFNARGATLVWVATTPILFLYLSKGFKRKNRRFALVAFTIFAGMLFYNLVFIRGFGDRLLSSGIIDGSSMTRLEVFNVFSVLKNADLMIGNSSNYLAMTDYLGAAGVENSFVVLILVYGLPIFVLLLIAYFKYLGNILKNSSSTEKLIILLSFLLVGSTNNGLAGATPWMFFVFCANSFLKDDPEQVFLKSKKLY